MRSEHICIYNTEVSAFEEGLEYDFATVLVLTVPAKAVEFLVTTLTLDHKAVRVVVTLGRVRDTTGQEEGLALLDDDVVEVATIDCLRESQARTFSMTS